MGRARAEPFPWNAAMEAGLGTLRLAPSAFWAMTPRELEAALRGAFGRGAARPMSRAELAALMALHPDI
ncbi:rcc01693 family protein [Methyloceanibacter sp.]|uniref:rcc01693 family protein n=1 Tax=Methyloceanibacter sp. TaxID=1965321 RepID=UPI002D27AE95|nr:rcc01693 family protein [Methyloceanibacter sp.]HZP09824.1 rcc01693 family protein [Methyloceanibacter sp.]